MSRVEYARCIVDELVVTPCRVRSQATGEGLRNRSIQVVRVVWRLHMPSNGSVVGVVDAHVQIDAIRLATATQWGAAEFRGLEDLRHAACGCDERDREHRAARKREPKKAQCGQSRPAGRGLGALCRQARAWLAALWWPALPVAGGLAGLCQENVVPALAWTTRLRHPLRGA